MAEWELGCVVVAPALGVVRAVNGDCPTERQLAVCSDQRRVAVNATQNTVNIASGEEVAVVGRPGSDTELLVGVEGGV